MSEPTTTPNWERFFATPEEYLEFEAQAEEKHEWIDGEVLPLHRKFVDGHWIAMAGGSNDHALICANVIGELHHRLKGGNCRAYTSDGRVRTPSFRRQMGHRGLYTYPDATVVCGERETETVGQNIETITNPTLLVEVLSPTTEAHDRGDKFERYNEIETFREYVLIAQNRPHVTVYLRRDNGDWRITHHDTLDATARLESVSADLPLAEVYAGVRLPVPGEDAP